MQKIFDTLINSYIEDKVGIATDFLSVELSLLLKEHLLSIYHSQQFNSAGIGNDTIQNHDKLLRSDQIYWLDKSHNTIHENTFFELMDAFILYLNATCYTGITGYEFHYAYYEKGSFYTKHLDQFKNNSDRAFSMIMYLNTDWLLADGGELRIHHTDKSIQNISPISGKSVFFKSSELVHEVLETHQPRLSITGWLKTG